MDAVFNIGVYYFLINKIIVAGRGRSYREAREFPQIKQFKGIKYGIRIVIKQLN